MSIDKSIKDSNHGIARSAGVIAAATLASRVLGFVRDIVIAQLFGVYLYAQAFVIAFKIPNLFRDLAGEGAANAAFVPVLSEYLAKNRKDEFWELANVLMNVLLVVLSAITIAGIALSPVLVRLIAPGFTADPAKLAATVTLNRWIFPYILLIGLTAYSTALLNSLRHFALPAFGPCLLNISIIVCALAWGEGIKGLASGVLIGGVLQLGVQLPMLYKKGFRFRFAGRFGHPAIRRIGVLMVPRVFSSAIYQLNNFADSIFGSLSWIVGEGGVAALYFAYRLIQFPLGVFGNSLSQAILPALSSRAAEGDLAQLKETLLFGLRSVLFVMIPASFGFMALSRTIISSLFEGGRFNSYSTGITSGALFFYSIGLFAYGASRILQCGYFAIKDTATPARVAAAAFVLNVCLNAIFMFPLKLSGLALATSVSGISSFLMLFMILRRKLGGFGVRGLLEFSARVFCAGIVMAEVCYIASTYHAALQSRLLSRIFDLAFPIVSGIVVYLGMCRLLRIEQARGVLKIFRIRP